MHPHILNWNIAIVAVLTDFTNMAVVLSDLLRNLTFNRSAHCTQVSDQCPLGLLFVPIWKTRWPPWPLIGWEIYDFSDETAEQNSTKLDRKQDSKVLYQVCVFRADRKIKMAPQPLIGWDIFDFSESLSRIPQNLTGKKISMSSTKFVFFRQIGKIRWPPWPLIGWDIFDFSSETAEREFNETWQEARSQCPLPSLCFSGW